MSLLLLQRTASLLTVLFQGQIDHRLATWYFLSHNRCLRPHKDICMAILTKQWEPQLGRWVSFFTSLSPPQSAPPYHRMACFKSLPLVEWGEEGDRIFVQVIEFSVFLFFFFPREWKNNQPQGNSKWKSSTLTLVVPKLCKDPFNRPFILVALKDKKGFGCSHADAQAWRAVLRTKTERRVTSFREQCR